MLTAEEFLVLIAQLCVATGATYWDSREKRSLPQFGEAELEVYWQALRDIPAPILRAAFVQVAASATWRGLPPAGALRVACVEVASGEQLTPGQAWELARVALGRISRYDPARSRLEILKVPADVQEVGKRLSWYALQGMEGGAARTAFCREYERLVESRKSRLTIPGAWPTSICLPHPERSGLMRLNDGEKEGGSGEGTEGGGEEKGGEARHTSG